MRLKLLPILLLVVPLNSCGGGPKLKLCISDPSHGGFDCYDERTGLSSFLSYSESDKMVALTPSDAQILLNYCTGLK
jgi:hypothetical protein